MSGLDVETGYPLSPLQQGMLFHALFAPDADVYVGQAHWLLRGDLDVSAFHEAWQTVTDRHSALRTSFDWGRPGQPLQLVHQKVAVPLEQQDWRSLSQTQQEERLAAFLRDDRRRGFDLTVAPLLRITLIRLHEDIWRVVWSGHHAVADGRSMVLVLREVLALHEAQASGVNADLPAPTPYHDFIAWLQAQDLLAAEDFWKNQLKGFTIPSSFRTRPAPTSESTYGASEQLGIFLARTTERRLHALARSTGLTVNTVIMAAWALLLSEHSGSEDVVFGLTVGSGGRGAPLSRSLVGLLINTLPVRVQVNPHAPLLSFLHLLRSRLQDVRRYAYTPLTEIQRWSDLPPATPLFDSIVVFDNAAIDRLATRHGRLEVGHLTVEQHSNYPLNLVVRRGPDLALQLIYHPGHFSRAAMERLAAQLEHVLEEMVADSERRLGEIPLLSGKERRQVLVDWNATRADYPQDQCFHRLFEEQAARTPDSMAIVAERERLTYRDLNRRANGLAQLLRLRGVGPETVVGVALERSPDLVVAMLGVAKAGGAFLLLDPSTPAARIASTLADARASLVVTHRHLQERLGDGARPLCLDHPALVCPSDENPTVEVSACHLAYVIYTSGTTGAPKGVMIEHRSVMNLISWHSRAFGISAMDRATQIAGPAFDAVIWEIWPYLTQGASLHIPADDVRAAPKRLQEWLLDHRITVSFLPTPLAQAVLALPWPPAPSLRTMLVGGDVLHEAPPASLPFTLINNYGPTECTVVATSGLIESAADGASPPAIGRPIANTQVYLLNGRLQPTPIGVVGEIYLGGVGLARGYLNRPELTAARFLAHPFHPGERVYRTGDLGRYREQGEIEFVGRIDRQIKLRGLRIEPGEIEATMRLHPEIGEAVVLVREDIAGDTRLVAYLVPKHSASPDPGEIRRFLRDRLPDYMIPTSYIPVNSLPLTLNGKVDRAGLPMPVRTREEAQADGPAPRTATERILAAVWQETLRLDRVGVRDDFFDLGGDSLTAVAVIERIRTRLGRDLAISDLFRAPTIEALAQKIEPITAASPVDVLVPIQPHGRRPPFFCAAPVLGTVFPYYNLVQGFDKDQPLYGLQPANLSTALPIESLARQYIEALHTVQPEGPYQVGGWSFGGLVAFEMAQQLRRAGHNVSLLAILDTPAPRRGGRLYPGKTGRFFLTTIMRGMGPYARDYEYLLTRSRVRASERYMNNGSLSKSGPWRLATLARQRLERAAIAAIVPPESHLLLYHPPTIRQMLQAFRAGLTATLRYQSPVFPGSITLLRTSERDTGGERDTFLGWDELTGEGVRVYHVPGNHMTLFQPPHVIEVAHTLQMALDQSHRAARGIPEPSLSQW